MLQIVGPLKPVGGVHPEPASEKNHFIRTGWGQDKVLGMATDNSESINELSEIQIMVFELGPLLKTEQAFPAQVIDGLERIGRANGGMVVPVHELKILHGILHIKEATRSVFHMRGSRPDQFLDLTFTKVEGGLQIPWVGGIDKLVTMLLNGFSDRTIAGKKPELDKGLSFKGGGSAL